MQLRNDIVLQAIRYLRLTLPEMSRRHIPATPENYAVWYEYVVGKNQEIVQAIDTISEQQSGFTDKINHDLYTQFIAVKEQAAVDSVRNEVRQVITSLLKQINTESLGLNNYIQSLQQFSEDVGQTNGLQDINIMTEDMLEVTRERESASSGLQKDMALMAHEIQQLQHEVERLNTEAGTDVLTQINNRRTFNIELDQAMQHAREESQPMAVLFLDIDHFKKFNDQYGHTVGDRVLRYVANVLKHQVRGADIIARYGGEEFTIILPDTHHANALTVAENIRNRVTSQRLTNGAEKAYFGTISVSIGVACYQPAESAESLINHADTAMYFAKNNGRNRVASETDIKGSFL